MSARRQGPGWADGLSMAETMCARADLARMAKGLWAGLSSWVAAAAGPLRTFIDLFSGLGGFHVALGRFGMRCVFACDSDMLCRANYLLNFGILPAGNIEKVAPDDVPAHDMLCAGVPCTTFSRSGSRTGTNDPRGRLYLHVLRIVERHKPKVVLIENVGQYRSLDGGPAYREIVESLRAWGYAVYSDILDAGDFGVPQRRARLFIVGILRDIMAGEFRFPAPSGPKVDVASILEPPELAKRQIVELRDWRRRPDGAIPWDKRGAGSIRLGDVGNGSQGQRVYSVLGHAPTQTASSGGHGAGTGLFLVGGLVRRLTARESARCMGFPDPYRFLGSQRKAASQAGNAVVPAVVEAIVREVFRAVGQALPQREDAP